VVNKKRAGQGGGAAPRKSVAAQRSLRRHQRKTKNLRRAVHWETTHGAEQERKKGRPHRVCRRLFSFLSSSRGGEKYDPGLSKGKGESMPHLTPGKGDDPLVRRSHVSFPNLWEKDEKTLPPGKHNSRANSGERENSPPRKKRSSPFPVWFTKIKRKKKLSGVGRGRKGFERGPQRRCAARGGKSIHQSSP